MQTFLLWLALVVLVIVGVAFNFGLVRDYVELRNRVTALEKEARTDRQLINLCLDSINELANPGGSITIENTVPEVRK